MSVHTMNYTPRKGVCKHALVLFMVQFGVECREVSLETALEHFNDTLPACCYIFPEFWTRASFVLPMF
jgi:hypothetical protein